MGHEEWYTQYGIFAQVTDYKNFLLFYVPQTNRQPDYSIERKPVSVSQ